MNRSGRSSLRVGSFNLYSGRSLSDGVTDPERLTAAVTSLDVEVLGAQEVDRFQHRSGLADQVELVASAMGAKDFRFAETVCGALDSSGWTTGRPMDPVGLAPDGPGYGIALFSTVPVSEWHELRLPPLRGRCPSLVVGDAGTRQVRMVRDAEPRAALAAVLLEPRITVAVTHLSFVPPGNAFQLRRVIRWLRSLPSPTVLVGDLNLPLWAARGLTRWTPLVTSSTFPSPAPRVQLDHILTAGMPPATTTTSAVLELALSDHRAVRADLVW